MGYVALSRVRSLDTLSLVGINRMALQVSLEALSIDETLRSKSAQDHKRFEHLRANAEARLKKLVKDFPKQEWGEKLAKMRQNYPNAYKPWNEKDDKKLVKLFSEKESMDIQELTAIFGRHPGSIRARLKKHFGDDAVY
jgi:hypothetical protein